MDDKTYYGSLAEAKIIYELTEKKYHIFNQVSGKAPFDLVAFKDNDLLKISVKSVSVTNKNGNYEVQLKRVRSNKTENKIYNFDPKECDVLAVFVIPLNKVFYFKSTNIKTKSTFTITKEVISNYNSSI